MSTLILPNKRCFPLKFYDLLEFEAVLGEIAKDFEYIVFIIQLLYQQKISWND